MHKKLNIQIILNYLRENVQIENRRLASENLHNEQQAFNEGDLFFKLSFKTEKELKAICTAILG